MKLLFPMQPQLPPERLRTVVARTPARFTEIVPAALALED